MRKASITLLFLVAVFAIAFAAEQPAPPGQDVYGPWEWSYWYNTLNPNSPYVPPSPSPWSKAWTIQDDCSNGHGALVDGGGYAVRIFSNITPDRVIHPCHNWFDVESLTTYICPPTSMTGDCYMQFELHRVLDDPSHGINWDPMRYQDGSEVIIPPFKIEIGDIWYSQQVPHFNEGLPDEAPLFIQDTSFWVVVRPVGPEWPGTNTFMWHDPTALPSVAHADARLIDNYDPDPNFYVFGEDLPPTNPYDVNDRHGVPVIAALISKHAYYPAITQPTPGGAIPYGVPVDVGANLFCRTSPSYEGHWENQDYGPVHFWITTEDGSQTVYDDTIDPFLFPNPPFTANPLPASFPQWDVDVPAGNYWMNCYNAFPHDWYTTNPSLKLDKKLITVYVRDVAVNCIEQPTGTYVEGNPVTAMALVENVGSLPANFNVRFWIPGTAYDVTRQVANLVPGAMQEVKFFELAARAGAYEAHCQVYCSGDMNPANDMVISAFEVSASPIIAGKSIKSARPNIASKTLTPWTQVALAANPVSRVARITVPASVPIKADIYTTGGRCLKSFRTNECDISDLANGVYLVKVTAYSRTKMLRLVVEH